MDIEEAKRIVAERFKLASITSCQVCNGKGVLNNFVESVNCTYCEDGKVYTTPDLTIYENLAPVLNRLNSSHQIVWVFYEGKIQFRRLYDVHDANCIFDILATSNLLLSSDLTPTLLTMIAEMISRGDV